MIHENDKVTSKIAMQLIGNISQSTAIRYIDMCRKFLNKPKPMVVTVEEFCNYFGVHLPK